MRFALGSLVLLASLATPVAAQRHPGRTDTLLAVHLLERATYGARPEDVAQVLAMGRHAWLQRQLHPERIADAGLAARLERLPAATLTTAELYRRFPPPSQVRREQRAQMAQGDTVKKRTLRRNAGVMGPQRMLGELVAAKLNRAAFSERQLEEVMTDFWFNHFNVFAQKRPVGWLISDYERVAIRPHVFGRFRDMLLATATHPAMLLYLDNARSVAPDSGGARQQPRLLDRWRELTAEQRAAMVARGRVTPEQAARLDAAAQKAPKPRMRGLNENYARELLELHTLGVDGGYTQRDVSEVARILTGWTVTREGRQDALEGLEFAFRPAQHDRGAKSALGLAFAAGGGREEGVRLLEHLAKHPSTARHVAAKLVRHFVSDRPQPALEARLARVFLDTGGDLREVTRALFGSDEFFAAEHRAAKLKTPFRLVASALRVATDEVDVSPALMQALKELGQVPYMEDAPTGYPAASQEWTSGGAMLSRMNFGLALGSGRVRGVSLAPGVTEQGSVQALANRLLPARDHQELVETIHADLDRQPGAARAQRALGLLLGSPHFQRH